MWAVGLAGLPISTVLLLRCQARAGLSREGLTALIRAETWLSGKILFSLFYGPRRRVRPLIPDVVT